MKRISTLASRPLEPEDFDFDDDDDDLGVGDWCDAESGEMLHSRSFRLEE